LRARNWGSRARARRGEHEQAAEHLVAALASGELSASDATDATASLGRAYALLARFEDAIGVLEGALTQATAINDEPAVLRFSVLLANTLIDRGNFGHAEDVLAGILEPGTSVERARHALPSLLVAVAASFLAGPVRPRLALRAPCPPRRSLPPSTRTWRRERSGCSPISRTIAGITVPPSSWSMSATRSSSQPANRLEEGMLLLERARALAALGRREEAVGIALAQPGCSREATRSARAGATRSQQGIFHDLGDIEKAPRCTSWPPRRCPAADKHLVDVYGRWPHHEEKRRLRRDQSLPEARSRRAGSPGSPLAPRQGSAAERVAAARDRLQHGEWQR